MRWMSAAVISLSLSLTLDSPLNAFPESNVRPRDARSAAMLRDGMRRSDTLRAIVERLEDTNVIVYVEMQPSLKGRLAGLLTWVTSAGRFRYLRAGVNPDQPTGAIIASVAHELQHALEVAESPLVRDEPSFRQLFKTIGDHTDWRQTAWDTEAARRVGERVRREIAIGN